jgi:hypothetical protein
MPTPQFDHDYINESIERLGSLADDAQPEWGTMTPEALPSHLAGLVLYSMGRSERAKNQSNWFRRQIFKRLVLSGIVQIPRNIKVPEAIAERIAPPKPYDVESLHALLEEYLTLTLADEIDPPPHPFLGPFSVDDWASFHYRHFEHHFRQFGV